MHATTNPNRHYLIFAWYFIMSLICYHGIHGHVLIDMDQSAIYIQSCSMFLQAINFKSLRLTCALRSHLKLCKWAVKLRTLEKYSLWCKLLCLTSPYNALIYMLFYLFFFLTKIDVSLVIWRMRRRYGIQEEDAFHRAYPLLSVPSI